MILRKLILASFFILQGNVLSSIGIASEDFMYVLLFMTSFLFIKNGKFIKTIEWQIFLLFIILIIFRYIIGILPESFRFACNFIIPCLLSFILPDKISKHNKNLYSVTFNILCVFWFAEILIALYESFSHTHLLTWIDTTYESHLNRMQTRPIGLVGAPLASSHILATLSFFILNLPLKSKYKYTLWSVNFFGILLYQGRVSIVATIFYFVLYLLIELKNHQIRFIHFGTVIAIIGCIILALFSLGLGSRLFIQDDGGSAEMRFSALTFFETYSWKDFLIGTPYADMEIVRDILNVTIIEIFVLCHFILFGILFSIGFYYLYMKLYFRIYQCRQKVLCFITLIIFFIMEATSISWFSGYVEIAFFLLTAKLLNENNLIHLIPSKYIDVKRVKINQDRI